MWKMGFPGGKESTCKSGAAGDTGLIPGWEDPLEEGMATHSSISCLENSMDRGAWRATVPGIAKSQIRLSKSHTHTHTHGFPGGASR